MTTLNATPLQHYCLRLGDTSLVLAQRLAEWCGHAPELEIDLALTNISLDLLGQARNLLSYAGGMNTPPLDEDSLAYLRDERQFYNLLLAEQPGKTFNDMLVRQFLLDTYHVLLFAALCDSRDPQLAGIAEKSLKEVRYHLRFSRGWMIRLGDGTELSQQKMQSSLNRLWRFTKELFHTDEIEENLIAQGIAVDPRQLEAAWHDEVQSVVLQAGLKLPDTPPYRVGGKQGAHTEHLGFLLAEMQSLHRAHPGVQW